MIFLDFSRLTPLRCSLNETTIFSLRSLTTRGSVSSAWRWQDAGNIRAHRWLSWQPQVRLVYPYSRSDLSSDVNRRQRKRRCEAPATANRLRHATSFENETSSVPSNIQTKVTTYSEHSPLLSSNTCDVCLSREETRSYASSLL